METKTKTTDSNELNDIEHELHDVEDELQDFEEKQVNVTRTLQMIVYPAMVAFIILSAYGFYLVQSLTTDVHRLTQTIVDMHESVDDNMTKMTGSIESMRGNMTELVNSTGQMSSNIVGMNDSTQDMAGNIRQMNASTQNMAVSTYNMQRDMWSMNKNISGPMKMFNKFNPFGSDKTTPYVVPPPVVSSPYYNYYSWPQNAGGQPSLQQPAAPPAAGNYMQQPPAVGAVPQAPSPALPVDGSGGTPSTAQDGHSFVIPTQDEGVLEIATRG